MPDRTTDQLLPPTPSHTVGPFYGFALPVPDGGDIAPAGHPEAITVHGRVLDGAGAPVPDALLEFWQAGPDGSPAGRPGSLPRDPSTGTAARRDTTAFTGFGRVGTDAAGHWTVRTLRPGTGGTHAPYLSVCVFARGLLHHLFTRIYLPDGATAEALRTDALFASLPVDRRHTLLAAAESAGTYRFDIRLQGEEETVFLDFR